MKRILVIDDDMDMCSLLSKFLQRKGFETDVAHSGSKGIAKVKEQHFDVVLCDFRLGDKEGREVLEEIKTINPQLIVIIITGYSDIKTAVDVIKQGAYDYITKPLIPDEVLNVIAKALEQFRDKATLSSVLEGSSPGAAASQSRKPSFTSNSEFIVGSSSATRDLYQQIELVAPTPYSVIIYGESGTGKEVVAKTIHDASDRKDKPFVAMDCGTLSKELSGSELFGHVKGSFTGALNDKEGHFELANGGTLFLDEVANLSAEIQASLLRVIQERKFKRVGGTKEMLVDVRIIVASNENLQEAYRKGKFREDLYHRFNEFSINIPPLRQRREDIPLFGKFFLEKACKELNKNIAGFDKDVMELFMDYAWPGNLREFRNVIRRAALLTSSIEVKATALPWEITNRSSYSAPVESLKATTPIPAFGNSSSPVSHDLKNAATQAEYETIMNVLKQVNFNKTKAAELLKIDRKTLYNKLRIHESQNEVEE